jgi:hypothetical protein
VANTVDSWIITVPAEATDLIEDGADEIRFLRTGIGVRMSKEHVAPDDANVGFEHVQGSAISFYGNFGVDNTTLPIKRPLGTDFDGGASFVEADHGRLAFNTANGCLFILDDYDAATPDLMWSPVIAIDTTYLKYDATTGKLTRALFAGEVIQTAKDTDATLIELNTAAGAVNVSADLTAVAMVSPDGPGGTELASVAVVAKGTHSLYSIKAHAVFGSNSAKSIFGYVTVDGVVVGAGHCVSINTGAVSLSILSDFVSAVDAGATVTIKFYAFCDYGSGTLAWANGKTASVALFDGKTQTVLEVTEIAQ